MKLPVLTTAVLSAVCSMYALAATDEAQLEAFEAECQKYAVEEGVANEDMEDYIAKCVREMGAAESEEGAAIESTEESPED